MKQILFTLFVLSAFAINAQEVKEQSITMSLGPQYAFYVEIDDTPEKVIEKEWESYLKEYFKKVKYNRKAKETYTQNGAVALINGNKDITIYSKMDQGKGQVTLYVWTDLGTGFVNPDDFAKQTDGVIRFLGDFYVKAKKKGITLEMEKEEDNLKGFEKDLVKLEKNNKDLHEDIEKYKDKIRQAEADIEENLKMQDDKKVEIQNQKKLIEKVIERLNMVGKTY